MCSFHICVLKTHMDMDLKILFPLLLSNKLIFPFQSKVFCECCAFEKIEKQNRDIELVFDVGNGGGFISYENDQSRALVFGLVNMTKLVYVDNMRIIKRTKNEVTLKISNLQMRNAGKYYVKLFEKYESEYCGVNLIVTKKPNVKIKYLDVHEEGVTFKCNTFSASRPSNHNLTMVYRWFVGDSLQQVISADLHVANTEQIHTDKLNLSCVASDNPHCSSLLNLTHDIKLDDINEDGRCTYVLGVAITPILNYSNLTLINTTSPNAVIGKTVQIIWILFAFPEINVDRKSYQTPSGIGTQFLDVTLNLTNTPLHYKLLLTLPVISQYDIGRYCVSVYNQMRRLTVCHTLTRDWTLVIGVSASGAVLLLVILAVVFSFIRRRNRSSNQATDQNDDISLHEQRESYETVPDREDEDINTSVQVHATRHSSDPSSASTPSVLRHTLLTSSLSTIHSENPRDDTYKSSSSTSSDSSCNANKKERSSTCTDLAIIVNYSSDTPKSSLTTNSSIESEVLSDYLNSYDQLDPQSQVSPTDNYQKLNL